MRFTILSQYYPPETGAPQNRLHDLARRFLGWGHRVEVLTGLPNYPGTEIHPGYECRRNSIEILDGVRVARVGLYVPRRKILPLQLLGYLSFAVNARRYGARLLSKADVLFMESPPLFVALAGVPLARQLGAQLVVNVSDLWPQAIIDLGKLGPGPALWASRCLEGWMYRRAKLITGQTEGIVTDIKGRFPDARVVLFPNGVDFDNYDDRSAGRDRVRQEFGWSDDLFVVGYTGVFGHSQALEQVVEAAKILDRAGTSRVIFALFGDGPKRSQIENLVAESGSTRVRIYPHQSTDKMPALQGAFDAGLVPLAEGKVFEGARPSKMFEYMAVGLPLVVCARGEAAALVGETGGGCGIVCPPKEPDQLAQSVAELAREPQLASDMGRRGREGAKKHFDRGKIAQDLERMLMDLALCGGRDGGAQ